VVDDDFLCIETLFDQIGNVIEKAASCGAAEGAACAAGVLGCGVAVEAAVQDAGSFTSRAALIRYDGSQFLSGVGRGRSADAAASDAKAELLVKISEYYAELIGKRLDTDGYGDHVARSFASVFAQQQNALRRIGRSDSQSHRLAILAELKDTHLVEAGYRQ
jgi:hypothetical protein